MSVRKQIVVVENNERYSKNYMNPVIPDGYRHVTYTDWKTGFQIERIKDGSLLEFIPVGYLKSNGTLNEINFNEKFGRRGWYTGDSNELGEEPINGIMNILWNQLQSVRYYGGFYTTCLLSRAENLKPISIPCRQPFTMIDFKRAMHLANSFEHDNSLSSHLLFGAEYDSILEWFVESERMTIRDAIEKELSYRDINENSVLEFGRVAEWTQERISNESEVKAVVRGTSLKARGDRNPLAWRQATYRYIKSPYIGARAALYIPI